MTIIDAWTSVCETCSRGCDCSLFDDKGCGHYGCWGPQTADVVTCPQNDETGDLAEFEW
jgi:hypothetical protein